MKTKCLVVASGGQDSTTCLFWAREKFDEVHVVTFDYGQRHRIEIDAARKVAEMAGVASHEVVEVPNCLISSSPLTSGNELEKYENIKQMDKTIGNRREKTFVPMRNALFLTISANRAEANGIPNLVTGVCQADLGNYDDCRQVFIDSTMDYINKALGHDHRGTQKIVVHTPLMNLSKAESVKLAMSLTGCWEALAFTHTSYDGCYPPTDMNHANVLRAHGFEQANLPDPLVVRAWREGLMALPETVNYNIVRGEVSSNEEANNKSTKTVCSPGLGFSGRKR
jgi:7-cyano-7-deazaguanine synthase